MAVEQYSNDLQTTINQGGGIASGDVSVVIASATGWPSTGQFHVLIESEIIRVTAVSGTTWTIVRGCEGTTAAAHGNGTLITDILTAESLKGLANVINRNDTSANQPAAGLEGRLFLPSDGVHLLREDGAVWTPWGPIFPMTTPPLSTSFTWVNQDGATAADTGGHLYLSAPNTGGVQGRLLVKSTPTPPYTLTVALEPTLWISADSQAGLVLRDSANSKLVTLELQQTTAGLFLRVIQWTNETTRTGSALSMQLQSAPRWLRINDNNTNRLYSVSADGQNWIQVLSEARTTWITANQIGLFVNANGQPSALTLYSWSGV